MVKPEINSGTVLLAEPFMMDSNFKRTAILLAEHTDEGSLGFIMNRPVNLRIDELIDDFPELDAPVFFGGPVQTDSLHYLHCVGDLLADGQEIFPGIWMGGDFTQLKFLIKQGLVQARDIRFFVGYSGWSEGQLKDELRYGSWMTAPMDINYLFKSKPTKLWSQVLINKGDTFSVIADMPDAPVYN